MAGHDPPGSDCILYVWFPKNLRETGLSSARRGRLGSHVSCCSSHEKRSWRRPSSQKSELEGTHLPLWGERKARTHAFRRKGRKKKTAALAKQQRSCCRISPQVLQPGQNNAVSFACIVSIQGPSANCSAHSSVKMEIAVLNSEQEWRPDLIRLCRVCASVVVWSWSQMF